MFSKAVVMLVEVKELIVHNLDVMQFMDILGLELVDIIDLFDEEIAANMDEFLDATT
jgi:hypothetical protein